MGLRDALRKKDAINHDQQGPEIFVRADSDSVTQQFATVPPPPPDQEQGLDTPGFNDALLSPAASTGGGGGEQGRKSRRSFDFFHSSDQPRSPSASSATSQTKKGSTARRLSHRLHLSRSPETSEHVPQNLPEIVVPGSGDGDREAEELQWEKRATMLAQNDGAAAAARSRSASTHSATAPVSSKQIDADIQEAIRLHEEGNFAEATKMFGRLADENGANNPLSQVLYGLALRHGWGCTPDPGRAVHYLTAAASNAAAVEEMAIQAGLKKGGAAKGELVLAIFELANCFRHGWGIDKDPIAAKQYYETAANLGDTDAMNEVAWCYLEGYGCKKDKYTAAQYYRLAEKAGNKTLGNTWIWKEKYDPGKGRKK
ncbi:HCP-like protein [Trichoderma citrinoviride]|uniref:HCP-like protein n=1 Tax=Trichoderma citrinoviride TaxID=58853 RepID=A0A2T4BD34_9HYPO|nr:HCP-like protein [Trichoderma citrinoviride]PTB67242.1 HCP-like protein [Trichoderma citrinoviride]